MSVEPKSPASRASRPGGGFGLSVADLGGLSATLLDDVATLEAALGRGLGGLAQGMSFRRHEFEPRGLSLIGTTARARVVVHTWPERGALTIDLYADTDELRDVLSRCIDEMLAAQPSAG